MARSITTRSINPKIMDDNIKILDDALISASDADNISYDNTDSGLTANNVQAAIDEVQGEIDNLYVIEDKEESISSFTVSANSYNDYSITLNKAGYTAVGVLGCIITGGSRVAISFYGLSATNTIKIRFNNYTSSAISMESIVVTVLYKKN